MPARIVMKNGSIYSVGAYREDVVASWEAAVSGGTTPIVTYDRLYAGIPLPKISIDLREVAAIEQESRS